MILMTLNLRSSKINKLQNFKIINLNNKVENNSTISNDSLKLIIFFNSRCLFCNKEIENILNNIDKFEFGEKSISRYNQ